MVNVEKVRLMTDLAVYEKKNKRTVFQINNYYRHDYIMGQMVGALVRYVSCILICFVLYLAMQAGELFYNINVSGLASVIEGLAKSFFAGLAIYEVIAFFVASKRYEHSRHGMLLYATKLRRLGKKYGKKR